jgi:hypothetical protein
MEVLGFMGSVHSKPLPPATEGGDVSYLTVSFPRFAFADRPGRRGRPRTSRQCDRGGAPQFVKKTHEHSDQSVLLQEMNEAFCREDDREKVQYATAAVLSNFRKTRDLIFTNAGHPVALWHDATENAWDWLDRKPYRQTTVEVIPLGTDRELIVTLRRICHF